MNKININKKEEKMQEIVLTSKQKFIVIFDLMMT
jgi:hypothetical protein